MSHPTVLDPALLPEQLKVELPAISLKDCPDSADLEGEYILERKFAMGRMALWSVRFEAICGFEGMVATLSLYEDQWKLQLASYGQGQVVVWSEIVKIPLDSQIELTLDSRFPTEPAWPTKLTLTTIISASSRQTMLENVPCDPCLGWSEGTVKFEGVNIQNDECESCESINKTLESEGGCSWGYYEVSPCSHVLPGLMTLGFWISGDGCTFLFQGWVQATDFSAARYEKYFSLQEILEETEFEIPNLDYLEAIPACFYANSTVKITINPPEEPPALNDACNKPGTCPPPIAPGPAPEQEFSIQCCGCGTGSGGGGCSSGNCSPPNSYGGVGFSAAAPSSGASGVNTGANNMSGDGGTSSTTIMDESVSEDGDNAIKYNCDGGTRLYVCRQPISSREAAELAAKKSSMLSATPAYRYFSVGNNTASLVKNDDDTFTETQDDGTEYDFLPTGPIFRIRKTVPQPGTWTITRDTGVAHIMDPSSRRTTFAYDGSGNLQGIEDPFQRRTTYAYSAGGAFGRNVDP